MTRHQGSAGVALVELSSRKQQHYIVRTDIKAEQSEEGDIVTFIETKFPYKPTMAEIKEFVYAVINAQTDEKIISGLVWNGKPVWLSNENQFNFSEADRKAENKADILPITFKIGEDNGTPVYHTFKTYEELDGFYTLAFAYINKCLNEGWIEKDSIDWTPYEQQLNAL